MEIEYKELDILLPNYLENIISVINKCKLENTFLLIGSNAFYLYTKLLNFRYTLITKDIDLAVLSVTNKNINFSKILEDNGWKINYDIINNISKFFYGDKELEFLNIKFDSRIKYKAIKELCIETTILPYLDILSMNIYKFNLNNKYSMLTPSIEAFYIHKLIISQRKDRKEEKKIKDLDQINYLSRYVSPIKIINILNNYKLTPAIRDSINKAIEKLKGNSLHNIENNNTLIDPNEFNMP